MKRTAPILAAALLCVLTLLSCASSPGERGSESPEPLPLTEADVESPDGEAPALAGYSWLDGRPFDSENYKGKPLILNYWAPWCFYCRMEAPSIEELYQRLPLNPLSGQAAPPTIHPALLTVVNAEDSASARDFMQEKGYTFPVLLSDNDEWEHFVQGLPMTYIISPPGRIKARVLGARDWAHPASVRILESLL
jgi:thiol-disulfide isomerase/thioredoxin